MLIKTPLIGMALYVLLLAGAPASAAPSATHTVMIPRSPGQDFETDFTAVDGRPLVATQAPTLGPEGPTPLIAESWGASADGGAGGNSLAVQSVDGASAADALPLARFAERGQAASPHGPRRVQDFIDQVRYGGLPEPAGWALMLVGFGLIGGALRGLVVANRRLARLQEGEPEEA